MMNSLGIHHLLENLHLCENQNLFEVHHLCENHEKLTPPIFIKGR